MKLNVVVFDLYLICEGNLGSCDVINVGGGGVVPADCVQYIVLSNNGCDKVHLFSLRE